MVNLLLASIESFLKVDQFFFELRDLFEDTLLLGHDDIVISIRNARAFSSIFVHITKIEMNPISSLIFIAFLLFLLWWLSPRFAGSLALHNWGWRIRSKTWRANAALIMLFLIFESLDSSPSIGRRLCFSRLLFHTESWASVSLLIGTRFRNLQPFFWFFRRLTAFPFGSRCFDI